jgi:lipopolysaccharide transport system ATP-binding protein
MSCDELNTVIRVGRLAKAYRLYENDRQWLKQILLPQLGPFYRSFWALRNVTFSVARGDSIGIVGRNGSGKSTILQILCGITKPTRGEIWVKGRVAPILALGSTFDLESTGRENILIAGAVLGLKRQETLERFGSIADFAGIGEFLDQPVKHFSLGMRARLAFAICAHVDADILIVDEALSVGDATFQKKCLNWIESFRERGTLLFVSHSTGEVERLCRRAIWIDDGRIRADGTSREVVAAFKEALQLEPEDAGRFKLMNDEPAL